MQAGGATLRPRNLAQPDIEDALAREQEERERLLASDSPLHNQRASEALKRRPGGSCISGNSPCAERGGVFQDLLNVCQNYKQFLEIKEGQDFTKIVSTVPFIFFAQILPALTFSYFTARRTENEIGAIEVVLSMAIVGMLFAVFSGSPMVVCGVTGPVCLFCISVFDASKLLGIRFGTFYFWVCAVSAVMHITIACCRVCNVLIDRITGFSTSTFGLVIGILYCYESSSEFASLMTASSIGNAAMYSVLLGLGTWFIMHQITYITGVNLLPRWISEFLNDYSSLIAIASMSLAYSKTTLAGIEIPCIELPSKFETSSKRPWLDTTRIAAETEPNVIIMAILPAAILTALIYFDHNASSIVSKKVGSETCKIERTYHWDFMILGISLFFCGALGIPPCYGLLPQAPLHVRHLAHTHHFKGKTGGGRIEMIVTGIVETRWSALGQSVLFASLLSDTMLSIFRAIPKGVLAGLLLSIGLTQLRNNDVILGIWNECMHFEDLEFNHNDVNVVDAPTSTQVSPKTHDAFLTHNWGSAESGNLNHKMVSKIHDGLRACGVNCWFDEERLEGGDIRDKIAQGVGESRTIVCFLTKAYKEKVNQFDKRDMCKYEFQLAEYLLGPAMMIPVVMEADMVGPGAQKWDGALGGALGMSMYIEFSNMKLEDMNLLNANFEAKIKELVRAINSAIEGEAHRERELARKKSTNTSVIEKDMRDRRAREAKEKGAVKKKFYLLQLILALVIFAFTFTQYLMLFPIMICSLVPMRLLLGRWCFNSKEKEFHPFEKKLAALFSCYFFAGTQLYELYDEETRKLKDRLVLELDPPLYARWDKSNQSSAHAHSAHPHIV